MFIVAVKVIAMTLLLVTVFKVGEHAGKEDRS